MTEEATQEPTVEPTAETATREEMVYAQARIALSDPDTSMATLRALMALITIDRTRNKSMTANEHLRIDVMRREAREILPKPLMEAVEAWAKELVGDDPYSVVTR